MKLCETCAHWSPPSERSNLKNVVRYYGDAVDESNWGGVRSNADDKLFGECKKIDLGTDLPMSAETPLAVTLDASDYQADLFTRAEFGCVLHEDKPKESIQ